MKEAELKKLLNQENSFDAIVIGAGPAGSTAAYLLAKSGFHVLVLDKKKFPRGKLCGGLLTRKTVRLLDEIFKTSPDYLTSNQIISHHSSSYGVNFRDNACIRGKLEYPFHFVDRQVYDSFWLNMARRSGAEFRSGDKVIFLDPSKNQVITADGHRYSGTYILGADGAPSRLLRLLTAGGFIKNEKKSGLATALELVVSRGLAPALPDHPVIYFGHIRWGYAWCFPRKDLRILGICGLNEKSGKFLKRGMRQFLKTIKISTGDIGSIKSHALPYGNYLAQPGSSNILLIGDACGLADPLLGEGIYYAHKSAQLAALAVIQSYRHSQDALKIYRQHLNAAIIPELKFVRIARQIIFSLPGSWPGLILSSLLKINPRKCEETIQGQRSFRWFRQIIPDR
ncbi:NAD(P)/FAD-dependent oxidoreductase [Thermodesulfobacteriota bacterium]